MPPMIPPGATTGIGSLPHADVNVACDFVLSSGCGIPFWPQLPKRDFREWMIPQYGAGLPGFTVNAQKKRFSVVKGTDYLDKLTALYERLLDPEADFPLDPGFAAGFYSFEEKVRAMDQPPAFLKGHVTGPFTFALGLNGEDGRPIYADEQLRDASVRLLARLASWQVKRLGALAAEGMVIFIDEPIASALGTAAYLTVGPDDVKSLMDIVVAEIHGAGGLAGIHCCGATDWSMFTDTELDILNFDAWNYFDNFSVYSSQVQEFLERGGMVAFGIIPTDDAISEAGLDDAAEKLDGEIALLEGKGVDGELLRSQYLLTPSCGCGSLTVEQAEKVFHLLDELHGRIGG